ncbi:MAG: permease, partial [Arcobacter skirrowii]|nr:permease [Aliarcobacter skirrowii]
MFDWLVNLSAVFVFDILGLEKGSHLGEALHFFIYDTIKIFILLITIIFFVTFLRSYFPVEKIRDYLVGKHKIFG